MLRISTLHEPNVVTLRLEGKVMRDWILEAHRAWLQVFDGKELIIDLSDVSFVDDSGRKLLAEMHAAGARLIGSGLMISALIEEIQREHPAPSLSLSPKLLLFLVGLLMTLSFYQFNS